AARTLDPQPVAEPRPREPFCELAARRVRDAQKQHARLVTHVASRARGNNHHVSTAASAPPTSCAPTNGPTSASRMPANVFVNERASVTAGFANDVDAVN